MCHKSALDPRCLLFLGLLVTLLSAGCSNHHLVGINVTPQNATVSAIGQSTQFLAMGSSSDPREQSTNLTSTVTWSSSNVSVATISADGLATAVGCGTTTINAMDGTVVGQSSFTSTCAGSGSSNPVLTSIALTPSDPIVSQTGQTTQFLALGTYVPATSDADLTHIATWASSNTAVATVSGTGLATAVACGTTTITAEFQGTIGQTQMTVACSGHQGLQSIVLYPNTPTIPQVGQTTQFLALAIYSPAGSNNDLTQTATWTSSNVAIATINNSGLATAVGCGTTTITAAYQGVIGEMLLTVACSSTGVLQAITVDPPNPNVPQIGQNTQFLALGTLTQGGNIDLTGTATWASSNPQVATVNASGVATAVSCGTTTVTAESQSIVGAALLTVSCAPVVSIQLLVKKSGSVLSTVVSSPAGIDCGTTCGASFNEGTGLTLTAVPVPTSWTGCDQVIANACSLTLTPDVPNGTQRTVTANF